MMLFFDSSRAHFGSPLGLDNMVLDTQVLVVLAGMQSRLCRTADQSARRTLGLYLVWIHVQPMAPPHLPHEWICSTPHVGCTHPSSSSVPHTPQGLQSLLRMKPDSWIWILRQLHVCGGD